MRCSRPGRKAEVGAQMLCPRHFHGGPNSGFLYEGGKRRELRAHPLEMCSAVLPTQAWPGMHARYVLPKFSSSPASNLGSLNRKLKGPNKAVMKARADCPRVAGLAIYTLLPLPAMDNLEPAGSTGSIQTPDSISDSRTWIQAASIRSLHLGHGPVAPALLDSGYHNNALRPWAVDRHAMLSSSGS